MLFPLHFAHAWEVNQEFLGQRVAKANQYDFLRITILILQIRHGSIALALVKILAYHDVDCVLLIPGRANASQGLSFSLPI